jgi:hypothetical protein
MLGLKTISAPDCVGTWHRRAKGTDSLAFAGLSGPTISNTRGDFMNAIKSARRLISANPASTNAKILSSLVIAVESEGDFNIARLYELDIDSFEMAISILSEWRLDRYYAGKAKLFDMALQVRDLPVQAPN